MRYGNVHLFLSLVETSLFDLYLGVTSGSSKLQWRFIARDGSPVYLQTEYKLIADHQNQDTIVARNEVLRLN